MFDACSASGYARNDFDFIAEAFAGDDQVSGRSGFDSTHGGGGEDTLEGNSRNDTLDGAVDNDTLDGGSTQQSTMFFE